MGFQPALNGTELWVIRHAPTAWNEERRYQGRTDIPLSEGGRSLARTWRLPAGSQPAFVCASPLARARETAEILFPGLPVRCDDRLAELRMGAWEGRLIADVEGERTPEQIENPWRGLDACPPGGESLREAGERLRAWAEELARERAGLVAVVSHKGAIHALYALATGWDGRSKPRPRPRFPRLHRFLLGPDGRLSLLELNVPLEESPA